MEEWFAFVLGDLLMISERSFDPEDIQEGYHHKREETQGTRELLGPGQQRRRGMKCDLDIRSQRHTVQRRDHFPRDR